MQIQALGYILAPASVVRTVVELGTPSGVSTIFPAAAIRANGGGRLITTEFLLNKAEAARANVDAAGLDGVVEIRAGMRETRSTLICRHASIVCSSMPQA